MLLFTKKALVAKKKLDGDPIYNEVELHTKFVLIHFETQSYLYALILILIPY